MVSEQKVRFRKKAGFTAIQNCAVDDRELSVKALGLYCRIQRWITYEAENFECTKAFIQSRCSEGSKAFDNAWNELKEKGYLKMYCYPAPRTCWEAELLDEPQPDTPHTYYLDSNGNVKSSNEDRERKRQEKLKNESSENEPDIQLLQKDEDGLSVEQRKILEQGTNVLVTDSSRPENGENNHYPLLGVMVSGENNHYPQKGYNGNGYNGNRSNGNGGNNINTINKTYNHPIYNLSIYPSEEQDDEPIFESSGSMDRMDGIDMQSTFDKVSVQIDREVIVHDMDIGNAPEQKDILNTIVSLIAEISLLKSGTVRINGQSIPYQEVQQRFTKLDKDHIDYILMCMRKTNPQIRNIRAYLLTSLYNAPQTMDAYYAAMVASAT